MEPCSLCGGEIEEKKWKCLKSGREGSGGKRRTCRGLYAMWRKILFDRYGGTN